MNTAAGRVGHFQESQVEQGTDSLGDLGDLEGYSHVADGTLGTVDKRSLEYLARRFREAEARTNALRQQLAAAIAEADQDGVLQKDICEATGYTRQQVRRIVQAENEGTEAAEPSEQIPADPTASRTRTQVE